MNTEITTPIKTWQPVDGETLVGQIVGTRQETGIYGKNRQALVKDANGTVIAVWVTRRLGKKLQNQCACKGDLITITFVGKKPSQQLRAIQRYFMGLFTFIGGNVCIGATLIQCL